MARQNQKAFLLQLMHRMGQVGITEKYLPKANGKRVYGYTYSDGSIEVNPVPALMDTIIHELIHSLHPEYSEITVRRITSMVCRKMSDEEMQAFYEAYRHCSHAGD